MRIVGLITEYNPFHNGHLHHLQESLRVTGADASVAVMSGHFLQRGEPALVDKWVRTEMALSAGVDLVLELPFAFACNSAPHFAMGAVQSLNALGVVDGLCFGSEAGRLDRLEQIAAVLVKKAAEIEKLTKERLRAGINFPAARTDALAKLLPGLPTEELGSPNNILGIEYLRALSQSNSHIVPQTIKRLGAGYHDTEAVGSVASATGIREMLASDKDIATYLPLVCLDILNQERSSGYTLDPEKLFIALQSQLLQEPENLRETYHVDNGLELRMTEAAMKARSYAELTTLVKSRHWTLTRIQRILCYVLMQADKGLMNEFIANGPLYLRLLGVSDNGKKILAKARKRRTLPMISDPSRASAVLRRFYKEAPEKADLAVKMLAYDLRATRIYGMLLKSQHPGHRNRDFFVRL